MQFFAPQGALNTLKLQAFSENIKLGKIDDILTMQLGYHGWIKHYMNKNEIIKYYKSITY